MLDPGLSALIADLDERGLLAETLVVAVGEFGRSPQRGVSTSGNGNSRRRPRPLALLLHGVHRRGRHQARLRLRQERQDGQRPAGKSGPSDRTAGDDLSRRRHQPGTIVYNHLNQPREMVQGQPVPALFA